MVGLMNVPLAGSTASSCLSFRNDRGTLSCLKGSNPMWYQNLWKCFYWLHSF